MKKKVILEASENPNAKKIKDLPKTGHFFLSVEVA